MPSEFELSGPAFVGLIEFELTEVAETLDVVHLRLRAVR